MGLIPWTYTHTPEDTKVFPAHEKRATPGAGHSYSSLPTPKGCLSAGVRSGVHRPTASASPGNLFEMHILRPLPRATESKTLAVGPSSPGDLRPQV